MAKYKKEDFGRCLICLKNPCECKKEETQDEKCARGEHKFVECDEWERTCINCGKFE